MKKLFATLLLLICVTTAFAGRTGHHEDHAINNPKAPVCHDQAGKWNPQDKRCDEPTCGCLFHRIEEFIVDLFV